MVFQQGKKWGDHIRMARKKTLPTRSGEREEHLRATVQYRRDMQKRFPFKKQEKFK